MDCICVFFAGIVGLLLLLNIVNHGKPELTLDIDYNPFNCDCKDYSILWMNRAWAFSQWLDRLNCDEPPELFNTKVGSAMYK